MCQLCLVNTRNKEVNKIILATLLQIDSSTNFHGTGFLSIKNGVPTIFKTMVSADNLGDLGLDINLMVDSDTPIFGHVRAASKGMDVTDENAHPFEGDRFVLAHNGRLYKKSDVVTYTPTDDVGLASDSLEFLKALEKIAVKNPKQPFLELLSMTMKEHKGKFALLIYDKKTKKFYVSRGDTADLHVSSIREVDNSGKKSTVIGYVVNTKKTDLHDSLSLAMPLCQIVSGKRLYFDPPELLIKNTVYEVKGTQLVEIGKVEENPVVFYTPSPQKMWSAGKNTGMDVGSVNLSLEIWSLSSRITKFMLAHRLTISDIDLLMYKFCSVPLSEALISDVDLFVNIAIPKLCASKDVRKRLEKITDDYFQVYPSMYKQIPELVYPWMLSPIQAINKMLKVISDQRKASK